MTKPIAKPKTKHVSKYAPRVKRPAPVLPPEVEAYVDTVKEARKEFKKFANKRNDHERERDLELITRLYCKGRSQTEIAEVIGLSRSQVYDDLKKIHRLWRETRETQLTEMKFREIARIENLEYEAWSAWDRSQKDVIKTATKKVTGEDTITGKGKVIAGGHEETGIIVETSYGDPRFLQVVRDCIEKRCEILGLNSPIKVEDTTPQRPIESMTKEEVEAEIARIMNKNQITPALLQTENDDKHAGSGTPDSTD